MAAIRIDDKAFADSRFALLAKLLGYAEPDFAIIKVARIWQLQTETFTPENPTYVVSTSIVTAMLGPNGPESLVLAKLATEQPGGLYIHGTRGRIEWLHVRRAQASEAGKASADSRKAAKNNERLTSGQRDVDVSPTKSKQSVNVMATKMPTKSNPLSLSLSLSLSDSQKEEGEAPIAACAAPPNPADAAEGSGGPQNQTAPAPAPSRSRKAVGTAASGLLLPLPGPGNPKEKTAATAQPIASGEVSQNATVTAKWFDRFERQTGAKPTWGKEAGAQLKRLLGIHGAEELCRRIDNAFDAPPFPHTPPGDFSAFVRHVDKYATRHGGVQIKPIQQQPRPYQLVPRVYGGDK